MTSPRPDLMELYGTGDVYQEKLAGLSGRLKGIPLAAAIGASVLGTMAFRSAIGKQEEEAEQMNQQMRAEESARNAGMNAALRGGRPVVTPTEDIYSQIRASSSLPASDLPSQQAFADFERSVREHHRKVASPIALASAEECGRMLAKVSGIGPLVSQIGGALKKGVGKLPIVGRSGAGWKTKALVAGGVGLGGYGAYRGATALHRWGQQQSAPKVYGADRASIPRYVNQWGQPVG